MHIRRGTRASNGCYNLILDQSLSSLESLDVISDTKTIEEAVDVEKFDSPSSFMLSLRCMASLQHNSKYAGLLAMRVSWIFTLLIPTSHALPIGN